ncbi:MAG TPA: glycoside hydrolase family 2 TIM barrel-domain containing protein, partial [Candidatus Sumerlaeota bacterium]|nr:glycoside hydrolase family 2 TIM barrel-domain containing protein [Candidatus Sumerlaeota bacterium]
PTADPDSTDAPAAGVWLMAVVVLIIEGWQPMQWRDVGLLGIASVFLSTGYYAVICAMRLGEVSVVAPFRYTSLLWALALGYLVWGEFPDWGCHDGQRHEENQRPDAAYITQWLEVLARDYSHPAIIGWCPLNETAEPIIDKLTALDDVTRGMFLAAKAMDQTRPVLDASGYSHRVPEADVYDSHDYTQDPAEFAERHAHTAAGRPFVNEPGGRPASIPWRGQPCFVSEFGGIWWNPDATPGEHSWGYGDAPRTIGEFYARFRGLCEALLRNPALFGYCYTQLTDVYQEQNGIYTFDRRCKFDLDRIRAIQQLPAAIEQAHRPTRPDDSSS